MKENSTYVEIAGKKFLVDDIQIDNNGQVTYNVSCLQNITKDDIKNLDDFVKTLLGAQ